MYAHLSDHVTSAIVSSSALPSSECLLTQVFHFYQQMAWKIMRPVLVMGPVIDTNSSQLTDLSSTLDGLILVSGHISLVGLHCIGGFRKGGGAHAASPYFRRLM